MAFVMLVLHPGSPLLSGLIPAQASGGCCRDGPCEVGVPQLVARRAEAFAPRGLGTRDEAARRRAILHPWEATALVHGVEQDETEDCANAWHGLSEGQGLGIVLFGRCEPTECEVAEPLGLRGDQREVDCKSRVDRRGLTPRGDAFPMGCVGDVLAACGQGILAVGRLHRRQECRAWAPQVGTASQHITGRAPLRRRDIGVWPHAAAQEGGHLLSINLIVFRLATVESFPRARVSQDEGDALCRAEGGEPIPGEETCYSDHEPLSIGGNRLEEWCWSRVHVPVEQKFALVAHDADVHTPGM